MVVKKWYESKTIWFNIITGLLFVIDLFTAQTLIPAGWTPYIVIFVAFINWVLRTYFTIDAIGDPAKEGYNQAKP